MAGEGENVDLLLREEGRRKAEALSYFAEALRSSEFGRRLGAKSIDSLIEASRLDPESSEPLAILKSYWFPRRMFGECVKAFLATAEANPGADELTLMVVEALLQQKEYGKAASLVENSLSAKRRGVKETARLAVLLGSLYGRMEDFDKGEELFGRYQSDPLYTDDLNVNVGALVFYSIGANKASDSIFPPFIAEWSKRRFQAKMDASFSAVERIFDNRHPAIEEVAPVLEVCRQFKMWDRFEHILLTSLSRSPSDLVIRNLLGLLYFEKKDYAEAARVWKTLSQENPATPAISWSLASRCSSGKNTPPPPRRSSIS